MFVFPTFVNLYIYSSNQILVQRELTQVLQSFHPNDSSWGLNKNCKYTKWNPDKKLIGYFGGTNTYMPWSSGEQVIYFEFSYKYFNLIFTVYEQNILVMQFIMVLHLSTDHWIVVRILIKEWRLEVYDSKLHELKDLASNNHRVVQLLPIARLFPRLLHCAHYWEQHPSFKKMKDELPIKFLSRTKQYHQEDDVSCGPYVCMYLDQLLGAKKLRITNITPQYMARFRKRVARRIFLLSRRDVDG